MTEPNRATKSQRSTTKITKAEQRRRFEETAKELGCDDGQALDAAFGKIVPPKVAKASGGGHG
jgi:hypothetical protein